MLVSTPLDLWAIALSPCFPARTELACTLRPHARYDRMHLTSPYGAGSTAPPSADLYQRDQPGSVPNGVRTFPDARVTQVPAAPSTPTWMTSTPHDWLAHTAMRGVIGFEIDRRFVNAAASGAGESGVGASDSALPWTRPTPTLPYLTSHTTMALRRLPSDDCFCRVTLPKFRLHHRESSHLASTSLPPQVAVVLSSTQS